MSQKNEVYKKMYSELFNTMTDVIEQLQAAQQQAEVLYVETEKQN